MVRYGGRGDRREALRASRMNGNMQLQGLGDGGPSRKLESTSSRKTEHPVYHLIVKNSDLKLVLSKTTSGSKMEKRLREGSPVTSPTWDPIQGVTPRLDTIIDSIVC